jgi:hypothetical protein
VTPSIKLGEEKNQKKPLKYGGITLANCNIVFG